MATTTSKAIPYWASIEQSEASAWNTCALGKDYLPGVCVVTAKKGRDIDIKKAKGQDGYTMTDNGASKGEVTITMTLATKEDWITWQAIRPRVDPNRPGAARVPLAIRHPQAQDRGIDNVVITDIEASAPTARGGMTIKIECAGWYPKPKAVKAKPRAFRPKTPYEPEATDPQHLGLENRRTFIGAGELNTKPPGEEDWLRKF